MKLDTTALKALKENSDGADVSNFQLKVTEITIEMDGLHITTVTVPDQRSEAAPDEARIGDFHMSLFTLDEWVEFSGLIEKAIQKVTK